MLKNLIRRHCFKIIGAATIFIPGLGVFGAIFGFIAGAFVDQLTAGVRTKRRLEGFISAPDSYSGGKTDNKLFISTAAVITAAQLCRGDSARRTLFNSVSGLYFPKAPPSVLEILSDSEHAGRETDAEGAAVYFGRNADEEQKNRLKALIAACGLNPAADNPLLEAAGIALPPKVAGTRSIEEDYALLGLKPGAGADEVKKVYHKLAAQFHPDGGSGLSDAQQKITEDAFIKIKSAYERLINLREEK